MIFHSYVNVYQRVSDWKKRHITSPKFVVDPQPIQLNWIYINPSLTTRCSMEVINMEAWFLKPQFRNWWNLDIDKNYEGLLIRSFSRDLDATWKAGKMNIRRKHQGVYVSTYANRLLIFFRQKQGIDVCCGKCAATSTKLLNAGRRVYLNIATCNSM